MKNGIIDTDEKEDFPDQTVVKKGWRTFQSPYIAGSYSRLLLNRGLSSAECLRMCVCSLSFLTHTRLLRRIFGGQSFVCWVFGGKHTTILPPTTTTTFIWFAADISTQQTHSKPFVILTYYLLNYYFSFITRVTFFPFCSNFTPLSQFIILCTVFLRVGIYSKCFQPRKAEFDGGMNELFSLLQNLL